ncbi:MAG: phage late control D family protein [Kluyvera sp.]|uniref:phage late control D family protein n=1 Tax=Kluyvera sp. TaxID=1538228 RepID=UPI003A8B59D9
MATLNPNKITVLLNWAGRAVTADLSQFVISITYTESKRKKSAGRDRIQLTLNNQNGIFSNAWYPSEGDILQPGVSWLDLITAKRGVWRWGKFTIDDIQFRFGPDQVIIGALASGPASDKFEQVNNRTWQNISLKELCTTLAGEAGMECSFTGEDTILALVQQRNESPRELLQRLSEQYDLPVSLKDASLYVGKPSLGVLVVDLMNRSAVKSADIIAASKRNTTAAVSVHYYNAETKEAGVYSTGKATDEKHTQNFYNVDVKDAAEAKRWAESKASGGGDKHEAESRITLINTPVAVGQPVTLTNCGKLPASWEIAEQTTTVSGSNWQAAIKMKKKGKK